MKLWQTMKRNWMITYPYTVFVGKVRDWGLSYKRYNLVLNEDTTTPYSILHVGPFEFFVRPRATEMDWFQDVVGCFGHQYHLDYLCNVCLRYHDGSVSGDVGVDTCLGFAMDYRRILTMPIAGIFFAN